MYVLMFLDESTGDPGSYDANGGDGYGPPGYSRSNQSDDFNFSIDKDDLLAIGNTNNINYNYICRTDPHHFFVTPLLIKSKRYCYSILLPRKCPSYFDFIYAIQRTQYELSTLIESGKPRLSAVYSHFPGIQLKNKTLLIDQNDIDETVTNEDLKKVYPFPIKIVSLTEIKNAIYSKDTTVAVFSLVQVLYPLSRKLYLMPVQAVFIIFVNGIHTDML